MNLRVEFAWAVAVFFAAASLAQSDRQERTFQQSPAEIQSVLKSLPGSASGQLPTLDGFVSQNEAPLDQYQRPFYRYTVHVVPGKSGGSTVRVTARITAWHRDAKHSGYAVLQTNGRLESDLLDRLQEVLKLQVQTKDATPASNQVSSAPEFSAPQPQLPRAMGTPLAPSEARNSTREQEAKNLEEILRSQSHPTNLIVVKQGNTPVLQGASADSKVLFLASAEDEFEILDENPEWVHVRISGLSRGWLRRSAVQMPGEDAPPRQEAEAITAPANPAHVSAAFSVSSEEVGSFPGNWDRLRGKNVKIISVQQAPGTGRITSPQDKMSFAESLFRKQDLSSQKTAEGLVLIFDAEDGGMIAATRLSLEKLKNGVLPIAAFWKQCFLDPPEILGPASSN